MDSLQEIPVEYKLDTFNMPHTGTTLCHPKIGYVNAMHLFRSRHLALNSPLGQFNGDLLTLLHKTHKNHVDSKVHFPPTATRHSPNYSEHNPSHVQRHMLPSQPFHQSILSPYCLFTHNLSTSPAAQTQTTFSMLQIKSIPKNT